jgi:hypothetical protein
MNKIFTYFIAYLFTISIGFAQITSEEILIKNGYSHEYINDEEGVQYYFKQLFKPDPITGELELILENNELKINWSYSKKCHNSETMTNLLNSFNRNLEQIVEFCSNLGNDIYSASDFPDSDLDDDDLNELLSQL